jgi:hypothetical protein
MEEKLDMIHCKGEVIFKTIPVPKQTTETLIIQIKQKRTKQNKGAEEEGRKTKNWFELKPIA